ncbi:glycosyltransferase family 2 protein [Hyphococcus lacteus]|uniref:Glycosyltransferase family A protein n=1 Tax=Hyphococcus lacteus TaxID=3143536 RepID=A0ABV3Z4Y8_9PROT
MTAPFTQPPQYTKSNTPQNRQLTVVVPFFNEEKYIARTLESILAQEHQPDEIILVNNGSTDRSLEICHAFKDKHKDILICVLHDPRPGKTNALETGLRAVNSSYVAFVGADTYYPPHYFALAMRLLTLSDGDLVGTIGIGIQNTPDSLAGHAKRLKGAVAGILLACQCHSGGYGHVFRTSIVRKAGGYSREQWPFALEDHEIVHRMLKHGHIAYHRDLWCKTSDRRSNRKSVSWNWFEVTLYHLTPYALKDWYFYRFLKSRFHQRHVLSAYLRAQPWQSQAEV